MRDLDMLAPIAADLKFQAIAAAAGEEDLNAFIGKSVVFITNTDCYILFGAATGFAAPTSTTAPFMAAGSVWRMKVKARSRFVQVIRASADGMLTMHPTISNVPDREPAA